MGNKAGQSFFHQALADVIFLTTDGLRPCPFCGGDAKLIVRNPKFFGLVGAYVECRDCGARTHVFGITETIITENGVSTPVTEKAIERGKSEAIKAWNTRKKGG